MTDPRPANTCMPCAGDAYSPAEGIPEGLLFLHCRYCVNAAPEVWSDSEQAEDDGKCLGDRGWPVLAFTAAEVARERAPKPPGGTVTNVTIYPAGTDPRLVPEYGGWEE